MAFRDVLRRISKVKSTILNDIWVEIVFFTLVATGECSYFTPRGAVAEMSRRPPVVTMVTTFTSRDLSFNNQLMTVLGTALGFVISFRTSTAYERSVRIPSTVCLCSRCSQFCRRPTTLDHDRHYIPYACANGTLHDHMSCRMSLYEFNVLPDASIHLS